MIGSAPAGVGASKLRWDVENATRCSVCEHELTAHDAIGLRFCRATQANALTRGCICPPSG